MCAKQKKVSLDFIRASTQLNVLSKAAQNPQNSYTVIYSEWKLKTEWKIEYWEANGPHPWLSKSRGGFHMVKSLLFSSSPVLENMFTHSYGRNLFNTRTEDRAAQRPHEPPDEGSRSRTKKKKEKRKRAKKKVRNKSGYIHMKCGPLYCSWKVESWCISGTDPNNAEDNFSIPCHFNQ